jgi:hypothetical protein
MSETEALVDALTEAAKAYQQAVLLGGHVAARKAALDAARAAVLAAMSRGPSPDQTSEAAE